MREIGVRESLPSDKFLRHVSDPRLCPKDIVSS
jgi:hypothetical protein